MTKSWKVHSLSLATAAGVFYVLCAMGCFRPSG
jgi:hypothetical protein